MRVFFLLQAVSGFFFNPGRAIGRGGQHVHVRVRKVVGGGVPYGGGGRRVRVHIRRRILWKKNNNNNDTLISQDFYISSEKREYNKQ